MTLLLSHPPTAQHRLRILLAIVVSVLMSTLLGCGGGGDLLVTVQGRAPKQDGSFVTRDHTIPIRPLEIRMVIGDVRLKSEAPGVASRTFPSLAPLLSPGEKMDSELLGKNGEFPGMWAADLMPGKTTLIGPGSVPPGEYRETQLRFTPATRDVKGIGANQSIRNLTIIFRGIAVLKGGECRLRVEMPFEAGIGKRIDLEVKAAYSHKCKVIVEYARWFDAVSLSEPCKNAGEETVLINPSINDGIYDQLRSAFPGSIQVEVEGAH